MFDLPLEYALIAFADAAESAHHLVDPEHALRIAMTQQ